MTDCKLAGYFGGEVDPSGIGFVAERCYPGQKAGRLGFLANHDFPRCNEENYDWLAYN